MSGSNWRRSYTIGLIVVGLAAAGFASWLWTSTETDHLEIEQQAAESADAYADPSNIAVEGECLTLPKARRADCITAEREASYEGQRNARDLEAQRVVATWTRAIGIATIIGMAFGIFGLSLIFVTFREARRAADAGFRANEIAEDNARRQLRAYVNVTNVKAEGIQPGIKPRFEIEINNGGQSPAYACTIQTFFHYCEGCDPDYVKIPMRGSGRRSNTAILPGKPSFSGLPSDRALETGEYLQILSGVGTFVFGGYVAYRDIFGRHHRTLFRYFVVPHLINKDGTASLAASFRQNKSN